MLSGFLISAFNTSVSSSVSKAPCPSPSYYFGRGSALKNVSWRKSPLAARGESDGMWGFKTDQFFCFSLLFACFYKNQKPLNKILPYFSLSGIRQVLKCTALLKMTVLSHPKGLSSGVSHLWQQPKLSA